jgi:hypothetical protein
MYIKLQSENLKGKLGVYGCITIIWILKKRLGMTMWAGFIWLRTVTSGGLL